MKQILLFLSLALAVTNVKAQSFDFQLTGNPVVTTGWTITGNGAVSADAFQLTTSSGNQAGSIYYSTPQNLTNCSQFTVVFDFRISNSSFPTADGLAFYYISNPPTGFTLGGGLGLPNLPNGLLLLLDTYDNDATPTNNPLVSLRRLDGTTNYDEGSTTGQLTPDLTAQSFLTDGNWHTCTLTYYFGTITVAFDGNAPVMTAISANLNQTGYFGFSAGTGALWATHEIKNVHIFGAPDPPQPTGTDITYCQGETPVPLTSTGNNLKWYTTPTGGTASNVAPTPNTAVTGTFNWYVSQAVPGCAVESSRDTVIVTVNPKPGPPDIMIPGYCSDQASAPIQITTGTNVLWYTDATGGTGSPTIPVVNTAIVGDTTFYVTQTSALGCMSSRIPLVATVKQSPVADFSIAYGYNCGSDTVHFTNLTTNGTSYLWDYNDGFTSADTNPTHIYTTQSTYYVRLSAQNAYCKDSTTKPVVIAHVVNADFTASDDEVCEGTLVTFTNTSEVTELNNVAPVYNWYFGDTATSTSQNASHQYTVPGTYQVMLVAQNAIPCYDTAYTQIKVDSMPTLRFTMSDTAACKGVAIDFTGIYTEDGLESFQWNFGEAPDNIIGVNPTTHAYSTAGAYTVTAYANYKACPNISKSAQVLAKAFPVINLGPDTSICLDGNPVLLSDNINASTAHATWLWSTGDTTSSILVRHHGTYTGTVTIDQCSTSDVVEVAKDCYLDIPNSFTPNGDGVNDYFLPRKFLSEGVSGFMMSVFDRWGQKIFETTNPTGRGWDGTFNGKNQPQGVYIYDIKAVMKNGRIEQYHGNVTLLR